MSNVIGHQNIIYQQKAPNTLNKKEYDLRNEPRPIPLESCLPMLSPTPKTCYLNHDRQPDAPSAKTAELT